MGPFRIGICAVVNLITVLSALLLTWPRSHSQTKPDRLPEGPGLAAKYPGDQGIEKAPQVVLAENFEAASFKEVTRRWESARHLEIMSLSTDAPPGSASKRSLLMTHIGSQGDGGHLYLRLLPGYDRLFARFYVKNDPQRAPIHHFFHVGGYNPATPYPHSGAGERPLISGRSSRFEVFDRSLALTKGLPLRYSSYSKFFPLRALTVRPMSPPYLSLLFR